MITELIMALLFFPGFLYKDFLKGKVILCSCSEKKRHPHIKTLKLDMCVFIDVMIGLVLILKKNHILVSSETKS